MTFTSDQLATAIEDISQQFFIGKDEEKNTTYKVLRVLFTNLIADVRNGRPLGISSCEIAKLARDYVKDVSSMSHIPKRLAEKLAETAPLRTSIDGILVEFEFFGPTGHDRRASGTADHHKGLYLVYRHKVLKPEATPGPLPGPHELRRVPDNFIGRNELLAELLSVVNTNNISVVGVRGLPGVGKTTFALAFAERLSDQYSSQIFLDLRGNTATPLSSLDVMTHVIHAYRSEQQLPPTPAELTGLYYTILNEQRALLVFDNARDAAQIQQAMPPKSCFLILTSRQAFTLLDLHPIDLLPLSPDDACALLLKTVPRCTDEAARIATLCGFLPIALCAAGSALAQARDVTPAEYAGRLADTRARLQLIDPSTNVSLEASLSLSYSLLSRRLRRRFEALSVFPHAFDRDAAAYVWRKSEAHAHDVLGYLTAFSLLTYDHVTDRYSLHDVVSDYARSRLRSGRLLLFTYRYVKYYCRASLIADSRYQTDDLFGPDDGLRLFLGEWLNIQTAFNLLARYWPALLAVMLDRSRRCLARSRPPADRLRWLEAATPRTLNKHLKTRLTLDMTTAYRELGDFECATECAHRSFKLSVETKDQRLESLATDIFMRVLFASIEPFTATQPALAALKAARDGGNVHAIRDALRDLGEQYSSCRSFRKAAECFREQLSLTRDAGSPDEILSILRSIAVAYDGSGDLDEVVLWSHEEVRLAQQQGAAAQESAAQGRLALCFERRGDTSNAHAFYERRLHTLRELGPAIPPNDVKIISREAYAWSKLGFADRATVLGNLALGLARRLGHGPSESHALLVLGLTHAQRGNYTVTKQLLTEAADVASSVGDVQMQLAADYVLSRLAADEGHIAVALEKAESALTTELRFFEPAGMRAHLTELRKRATLFEQ